MADLKRVPVLAAVIVAIAAGALVGGCSEDATQSNSLLAALPLSDFTFRDTTLSAVSSAPFIRHIGMDGTVNLIGMTGKYTAYTMLQFIPAYFPYRDTAVVYSASLTLRKASWFGPDSTQAFGFTVYRVLRAWNALTVTWDTVDGSFYESSIPRGAYTGPDTGHMVVNLDTAMVREWLSSSTTANKLGIILVPNPGTNVVRGINQFGGDSASFVPSLRIIAGSPSGSPVDTTTFHLGQGTFVGNVTPLIADPTLMYLQSGLVGRSVLMYDVSSIPRGAIINSASMQIQENAATQLGSYPADTTVAAHVMLSATDTMSFEGSPSTGHHPLPGSTSFTFDVRHAVQSWVRGPNYGLLLRTSTTSEYSSFDLYVLYGPRATDPTLRPRIKITYSIPKK